MANQPPPTWQDKFFLATFQQDSNPQLPTRRLVRIVSPLVVTDDPTDGVTEISGGGGSTLQIEYASTVLPARGKLQILGNAKAADNSGNNSTDLTIGGLIEFASSTLPQRSKIQLLGTVSCVDNPGNDSTDVTVAGGAGGSLFGPFSSRPLTAAAGTQYITSDGPMGFVFDGTLWRPIIDSTSAFDPPPSVAGGGWSQFNASGNATSLTDSFGTVLLECTNGSSGEDIRCAVRSGFGGHKRIIANIVGGYRQNLASAQFGLVLRESSTGNVELYTKRGDGTGNATFARHQATASDTSGSPTYSFHHEDTCSVDWTHNCPGYWFRIEDDGANRTCFISINGFDWIIAGTPSSPFQDTTGHWNGGGTFAPDQWGLVVFPSATSAGTVITRLNAVTLSSI